jgi:hypothetical protein
MLAVLFGIVLVIVAVVLWVGGLSVTQALAIVIGIIGIMLIVWWAGPATAWGRRDGRIR